jgi:hypothetical protein
MLNGPQIDGEAGGQDQRLGEQAGVVEGDRRLVELAGKGSLEKVSKKLGFRAFPGVGTTKAGELWEVFCDLGGGREGCLGFRGEGEEEEDWAGGGDLWLLTSGVER